MVNWAVGVDTDTPDFTLFTAFGDDGFRGELAGLILWPVRLLLLGWLFPPDFDVAVARNCGTSLLLHAIGGADLNQFGFCSDCLAHVRLDLRRVALWVGA